MTPAERKRFEVLRRKERSHTNFDDEEVREFDRLRDLRNTEIMRMIPILTCCEASRNYPTVTFTVDFGEKSEDGKGYWYVRSNSKLEDYYRPSEAKMDPSWYENRPHAKFCPYCGTPVPKMRRKDPAPKTLTVVTDGGYYCDTCSERLNCCMCDPLSSAFEPVREKKRS